MGKDGLFLRFWSKDILYRTDECVRTIDELIFLLKLMKYRDNECF